MRFGKLKSLFLGSILVLFLSLFLIHKTYAVSASSILIDIVPPYPVPYENVTINLNSYASNLDSVLITWYTNGKISSSGVGKKTFTVTAGTSGSETKIKAKIALPDGDIETNITIRPSVMELLWQANDSYVPPFYKGKALPSPESEIKVVAMPEIKDAKNNLVNSQNMTYAWQQDYTNNVDGSGYGKNFFLYTNDYLDDSNTISVTATTLDQKYSSQADITISNTIPKIDFYKNDLKMGTNWNKTVEDNDQINKGDSLEAIPYFISPKELEHPYLIWNWYINDDMIDVPIFKINLIPLSIQDGIHGTSKLRLEIRNQNRIFEHISKEINVTF